MNNTMERPQHVTVSVASSTGRGSYRVVVDGALRYCQCPSWRYRSRCRHVTAVLAALHAGIDLARAQR